MVLRGVRVLARRLRSIRTRQRFGIGGDSRIVFAQSMLRGKVQGQALHRPRLEPRRGALPDRSEQETLAPTRTPQPPTRSAV
jgi:hypothetical protein